MKKIILSLVLISLVIMESRSQSLYMPRNVKSAFEKGTRSLDGKPGPNYWQNRSNYNIDLTVTPPDRLIKGSETITYFNNSPDTLHEVVFRLWLNYHLPQADRMNNMAAVQLTSGMHIDHFKINGEETKWPDLNGHYTWESVRLSEPLFPRDSIRFNVQWHFDIAPAFIDHQRAIREGMIDSGTCMIAYFYPQVAVYDDYNGWDRLQFTGAQEFYNDFSNYTLHVSVPKNFIVWATGTLQNPDQVLQPHYAQLLKASMTSDSVIHIATPNDYQEGNITAPNNINTWKWKAKDVTETALFISNHDNWDAASVLVDSITGRRASVQAAYEDSSSGFHDAVAVGLKALSWYSRNLPGVPYPYPKMTIVEGFGGMEYPMMANDGSGRTSNPILFRFEENHEIAHTYFPFYMGTNESRYAFMDEGWAETFNGLVGTAEYGAPLVNENYERFLIRDPSQEEQVPIVASNYQTGLAYTNNAYFKPMLAYMALKDLLGYDLFQKCLRGYMARWNGHHPIPWDFFNAFSNISGKNLDWFWNSWFFSHGYTDVGIKAVKKRGKDYEITIKNTGGFDIPFDIRVNYSDGTDQSIHETPSVWESNSEETTIHLKTHKKITSLMIDTGLYADANEGDNAWKMK